MKTNQIRSTKEFIGFKIKIERQKQEVLTIVNEQQITFTTEQLLAIINLPCKPYAGIMHPNTYFSIRKRYFEGTLKEKTLIEFFTLFGFEPTEKRYKSIAPISSEIAMPDVI